MTVKQSFLNRRIDADQRNIWLVGAFYGVAVYLVLIVLQPFGISSYSTLDRFLRTIPFGIATWLCVVAAHYALHFAKKDFFAPERWTVGRCIVCDCLTVLFVVLGNLPIFTIMFGLSLNVMWTAVWQTVAVGACLIGARVLLTHKKTAAQPSAEHEVITISGTGRNDFVRVLPDDLLYIESDKNYCNVVTANGIKQLRLTMTNAEEQLKNHTEMVRCHRAYIVNTQRIITTEGNASVGYKLRIGGTDTLVPVGRSYVNAIRAIDNAQ